MPIQPIKTTQNMEHPTKINQHEIGTYNNLPKNSATTGSCLCHFNRMFVCLCTHTHMRTLWDVSLVSLQAASRLPTSYFRGATPAGSFLKLHLLRPSIDSPQLLN